MLDLASIWVGVKTRLPFGGTLNIRCRIILGTQKGDPDFDTYPCLLIRQVEA